MHMGKGGRNFSTIQHPDLLCEKTISRFIDHCEGILKLMLSKNKRPYDPESLAPSRRLRCNLGNVLARNELSATRLAEVVNDINRVAPTQLHDLTGRLDGNCPRNLRRKFLRRSAWMPNYTASLRVWDPKTQAVVTEKVEMQLPHEILSVLLKFAVGGKLQERAGMDPLTLQHLQHCEAQAGCALLGVGLWGDGAPTQWDRSESIDVISLSLPGLTGELRSMRVPLVVLPHSRICSETWMDFFAVMKWSFVVLATGQWPKRRHDGQPWDAADRCRVAPRPLPRAALVECRQDWKFAAEVFGFPSRCAK
jgi:hypothetical protein